MRGRTVTYHGEAFTRPMRDAVRENLFNLIGPAIRGTRAFDLFAGTAALAIESVSRGAADAVAIERDAGAAKQIRETCRSLGIERRVDTRVGDAFKVSESLFIASTAETPWTVFLCPPYRLWTEEADAMRTLVRRVVEHAPPGSVLAVETETSFDVGDLPGEPWDVRDYGANRLGLHRPAMVCGMGGDDFGPLID